MSDQSKSEFLRKDMIWYLSPFIQFNNYTLWCVFFPLCFTAIIGDSIFHILILFTKTKLVVLRTNLQGNKWWWCMGVLFKQNVWIAQADFFKYEHSHSIVVWVRSLIFPDQFRKCVSYARANQTWARSSFPDKVRP